MVLVHNKYKNTLVGALRTQMSFVMRSLPSCYVTLRTQVIRLNSGNLGPQKTDSGVFYYFIRFIMTHLYWLAVTSRSVRLSGNKFCFMSPLGQLPKCEPRTY